MELELKMDIGLLISFVLTALMAACFIWLVGRKEIMKFRGRKMVKLAKANGPVLVMNNHNGVTAVCTFEAFKLADRDSYQRVIGEKDPDRRAELFMNTREVLVIPTFTFAAEDAKVMAHTGYRHVAEEMRKDLVKKTTGYDYRQVPHHDFEIAARYLIKSEPRLLIPFMRRNLGGLNPAEQMEAFGNKSVAMARLELLHTLR